MHKNMISVAEHASEIRSFLEYTKYPDTWDRLADWLMIASGIVNVRLDCIRFDKSYGWCSSADEFTAAHEELLQHYVTELTRFTYCWAALECAIETIAPPCAPRRGKINDACYYIQRHSHDDKGFLYYWDVLAEFRQILVDSGELSVLNRFTLPSFVSIRSTALYVIYKTRNDFVHGTLYFPLPDSDNRPKSDYIQLVHLASRLNPDVYSVSACCGPSRVRQDVGVHP